MQPEAVVICACAVMAIYLFMKSLFSNKYKSDAMMTGLQGIYTGRSTKFNVWLGKYVSCSNQFETTLTSLQ